MGEGASMTKLGCDTPVPCFQQPVAQKYMILFNTKGIIKKIGSTTAELEPPLRTHPQLGDTTYCVVRVAGEKRQEKG